jgi:hypothetical protein
MEVGLLTQEQKDLLVGNLFQPYCFFYPVLDGNTPPNWIISTIEMYENTNPDFSWVSELPIIEYVKPRPESHFDQFFLK